LKRGEGGDASRTLQKRGDEGLAWIKKQGTRYSLAWEKESGTLVIVSEALAHGKADEWN